MEVDGVESPAVNYTDLTGSLTIGDAVLLNTTAFDLGLGTGGVHFVIANMTDQLPNPCEQDQHAVSPRAVICDERQGVSKRRNLGHIMKLRYTPSQISVLSVEEDDSPHREAIRAFQSLDGMPVVCCELHSQIAAVAAAVKAESEHKAKIAYVMTDGAALPLGFSMLYAELREKELLDAGITCGQAFGGDIEAINLYTALIAAKQVVGADIAVVCQGPGNAGTESKYGFSGLQQGEAINAVNALGGRAVAVLRMSFADRRERHRGISHHSKTVLEKIAVTKAYIAVPELRDECMVGVEEQLSGMELSRHEICRIDAGIGLSELARSDVRVTTMGRCVKEDEAFFLAASGAGVLAVQLSSAGYGSVRRNRPA
jgi:hypothetical protein